MVVTPFRLYSIEKEWRIKDKNPIFFFNWSLQFPGFGWMSVKGQIKNISCKFAILGVKKSFNSIIGRIHQEDSYYQTGVISVKLER